MEGKHTLPGLPTELKEMIIRQLGLSELLALSATNKEFYELCTKPKLWTGKETGGNLLWGAPVECVEFVYVIWGVQDPPSAGNVWRTEERPKPFSRKSAGWGLPHPYRSHKCSVAILTQVFRNHFGSSMPGQCNNCPKLAQVCRASAKTAPNWHAADPGPGVAWRESRNRYCWGSGTTTQHMHLLHT